MSPLRPLKVRTEPTPALWPHKSSWPESQSLEGERGRGTGVKAPSRKASGRKGWRHQRNHGGCFSVLSMAAARENNIPDLILLHEPTGKPPECESVMRWPIWVGLESFPSPEILCSSCLCFPSSSMLITQL